MVKRLESRNGFWDFTFEHAKKKKKKMKEEDQGRLPGGGNPGPNDEMGLVRRRGGMKEKGFSF